MAKYPVEIGDDEGTADAVNYLLSGPAGLGQNFAGFSSYTPAYLTGNFRIPFSQTDPAELYVPPINIDTVEMLDDRTVKVDYTSAGLTTPPFSLGNGLSFSGITDPAYNTMLNDDAVQIGVVECTNTYVIVRLAVSYPLLSPSTGGTVEFRSVNFSNSTDCDVRVTVTGGTDRVFISAQLDQVVSYTVLSGTPDMTVYVDVNRYIAQINNDPVNPDYIFNFDETISEKAYTYTGLTGTGSFNLIETVFTSIIDKPKPAYYRYIVEVYFQTAKPAQVQVTTDELRLRSISAQVVKQ